MTSPPAALKDNASGLDSDRTVAIESLREMLIIPQQVL